MVNLILSIACLTLGICLILYYNGLKKEDKGGLRINILGSGIGFLIIGFGLILQEFF